MGKQTIETVALIAEIGLQNNAAPKRIQILPAGRVKTTKGELLVDEEAGRLVRQAMGDRGVDLAIDYEHQTEGGEFASPDGKAPAAGWMKGIGFSAAEGLYADVDWTPKGGDHVANKEYRYLSPVVDFDMATRRVFRVKGAALVNRPATINAKPLVLKEGVRLFDEKHDASDREGVPSDSASEDGKDRAMKNKLIGVLALKSDASEDEIVAAVRAAHEKAGTIVAAEGKAGAAGETLTMICSAAGITETEPAKMKAAAMVLCQKAKDHDTLKAENDRLHAESRNKEADTLILSAKKAGKLVEAQEPWARELILSDKEKFVAWEKNAPVVRPQGKTDAPPTDSLDGSDRGQLILSAGKEYDANSKTLCCTRREYVDEVLREKGQALLTDADKV
jgi:phage I-like protein